MSLIKLDTPEKKKRFVVLLLSLVAVVTGYSLLPDGALDRPLQEAPEAVPVADPYEGWGEIRPGGVISLRIPPGCKGDPGAGSTYVYCGDLEDQPLPEFVVSSDGIQVNVRRYEDLEVREWDKILSSMKLLMPLNRAVQINIDE